MRSTFSWVYSSLKCVGLAHANKGSHSFTCHPHAHLTMQWAILPFTLQSSHFGPYSFPIPQWIGGLVGLGGYMSRWYTCPKMVTHPSSKPTNINSATTTESQVWCPNLWSTEPWITVVYNNPFLCHAVHCIHATWTDLSRHITVLPLIHSVARELDAIAEPQPNVLNFASIIRPCSSTFI